MVLKRCLLITVICSLIAQPIFACLWDHDTLKMERSRFPSVLELITGKFLRHSDAFYQWRITDRSTRIENGESTKELYDDLAVAYDKTGQHDKAIETILKKDALWPGLYETLANHGTFLIHSGQLEDGLVQIRKAIKVNRNAHFGREIYQQRVVEYVLSRQDGGKTILPLGSQRTLSDGSVRMRTTFADYLFDEKKMTAAARERKRKQALKGVSGMMRFGNHDSPILLEVLGDLLYSKYEPKMDAKWLAARAYLQASIVTKTKSPDGSTAYFDLAKRAIGMHENSSIATVRRQFTDEIKAADKWWRSVESDEAKWIRKGVDVDAEFSQKYFKEPQITVSSLKAKKSIITTALAGCLLLSFVAVGFAYNPFRKKSA